MNILDKKRWHVRRRENLIRVRKDEAKAAEEENIKNERALLADQEFKTNFLRKQASTDLDNLQKELKLYQNLDKNNANSNVLNNSEYAKEISEAKEKEEKSIGLLTYLGQSVLESKDQPPLWYISKSHRNNQVVDDAELFVNKKHKIDPMTLIKNSEENIKYQKREKTRLEVEQNSLEDRINFSKILPVKLPDDVRVPKSLADGMSKMDKLRAERLQREHAERERATKLFARHNFPDLVNLELSKLKAKSSLNESDLPYNSSFNPEIAMAIAERNARKRKNRYNGP